MKSHIPASKPCNYQASVSPSFMPQKIRIAHVLHSFGTGGLEKGIATLVNHASPEFEHVIVCLSKTGDSVRLLPKKTEVLALCKPDGNSLRFIFKLASVLRSIRPDVVHTRNWGGMDGVMAACIGRISCVVHGEHGWEMADPDGRNARRIIFRRLFSRCIKEYTCVSQQMVRWMRQTVRINKPIAQIYNGIETSMYCRSSRALLTRQQLGIPENAYLIGTVGRLDPIKDHPTLFRAFDRIRKTIPEANLMIVGDGVEKERLHKMVKGKNVWLMGNRPDVPQLLGLMDLFVLPSKNEGISNTILEAMATSLPVIATRVGGNPELITDEVNGFLVDVGDDGTLADLMIRYYRRPKLRKRHGTAGLNSAVNRFSTRAMVDGYESVYRRLLSKEH